MQYVLELEEKLILSPETRASDFNFIHDLNLLEGDIMPLKAIILNIEQLKPLVEKDLFYLESIQRQLKFLENKDFISSFGMGSEEAIGSLSKCDLESQSELITAYFEMLLGLMQVSRDYYGLVDFIKDKKRFKAEYFNHKPETVYDYLEEIMNKNCVFISYDFFVCAIDQREKYLKQNSIIVKR